MTVAKDPLAPFDFANETRLATLAARIGCTEGQLWSMAISLVLAVVVLGAALPDVAWRQRALLADSLPADPPIEQAGASTDSSSALTPPLDPVDVTGPGSAPLSFDPLAPSPVDGPTSSPSTTIAPTGPVVSSPAPAQTEPLAIVGGGWVAAHPGDPLATTSIPEGAFPVALQLGQPDKISFVRLAGSGTTLELLVEQSPGATVLPGLASIVLCAVQDDTWDLGGGDASLDDAPTFDCDDAVVGQREAGGARWSFTIPDALDPTRTGGFALVPDTDAQSPSFQVTFAPTDREEP